MRGDLALVGGVVRTLDAEGPLADAVLVRGDRIAAVGTVAEVRAAAGPDAEVMDLAGRALLPGFQDAHVHPSLAGPQLTRCDLLDLPDRAAYLKQIAGYAAAHPDDPWIIGKGWAMSEFPGGVAHRTDLDAVVPGRPALFTNRDGHGAWVNTKALELAGIDAATPDPPDGRIERDPDGIPSGTLQEGAVELVRALAPRLDSTAIEEGILAAQRHLLSLGVTGWQDASVDEDGHAAYVTLAGREQIVARTVGCLWWERTRGLDQLDELAARRAETPLGRYQATTVKVMVDGVVENHTAAMLEPYLDGTGGATGERGISFVAREELLEVVPAIDGLGFQVHFHALGDRAVRDALDAVGEARRRNGANDLRHHLAHLQIVHPSDRPRFAELGAVANAQPLWAQHEAYQADLTIPFLGPERSALQYPWRSLLDSGALLALGSDWDVSTPDPFEILHVAVHRSHPDSASEPFFPEERIGLDEAMAAYTLGSAHVSHLEGDTGSITPGKLADIVVVDRDPFEHGPLGCRVDLTLVGGEVVFER